MGVIARGRLYAACRSWVGLADEKSLYLIVQPNGGKWWRLKYRFGPRKDGKPGQAEKSISLGTYRECLDESPRKTRRVLATARGRDRSIADRQAKQHAQRVAHLHSFKAIAEAWMDMHKLKWTAGHSHRTRRRFERYH